MQIYVKVNMVNYYEIKKKTSFLEKNMAQKYGQTQKS